MAPEGYVRLGARWYYLLHPRPVYILAARGGDGRLNFMAASWVMPFSEEPPRIIASLDKEALTTRYISESGVFSINVYSIEERDFVYTAGTTSGRRVDKQRLLGVEAVEVDGAPVLTRPRPMGFIVARLHRLIDGLADDVYLAVADLVSAYGDEELFNQRYGWELRRAKILMHAAGRAFTTNTGVYVAKKIAGNSG